MKNCPFFEEKHFRYCKALAKRVMVPSRSEKEEFCCEHYQDCPYYKERQGESEGCDHVSASLSEENNESKE
jgi:hypothetical protein